MRARRTRTRENESAIDDMGNLAVVADNDDEIRDLVSCKDPLDPQPERNDRLACELQLSHICPYICQDTTLLAAVVART